MILAGNSPWDRYQAGDESAVDESVIRGFAVFEDKGGCGQCHMDEVFTDSPYDAYHNIGVRLDSTDPDYGRYEVTGLDEDRGAFKTPTLRNVAKGPGKNFIQAYMHNGVFKSLKEVVHFYNTRDVESWPPPEVPENVNDEELGDLGLTDAEEDAIVAFMKTLSDGYDINKMKKDGDHLQLNVKTSSLRVEGPNPFNPSTILGYYIPDDSFIQLDVFSITGEKVATLQNGFMSAGEHQVVFNAENLATGIYLVSLNTGKEVNTVKLMLMK